MLHGQLKSTVEIVGVFAIVASLIFVGLQLKQEDDIAQLEMFNRSIEQQREFADWITQHADIWQRGCIGEELTESEQLIFGQIFSLYSTHTYLRWLRFKVTDFAGSDGGYVIDAYAANIHRYPGIRAEAEDRTAWVAEGRRYVDQHIDEYRELTAARLEELQKLDPNPKWHPKHCGF